MQRFLRASAVEAGEMLRPTLVDGQWRRPLISKRKAAALRKTAIRNGTYGNWVEGCGGWLRDWDPVAQHTVPNPPRLHSNMRNLDDRISRIQLAMEKMPEKVKEMKAAQKAARPLRGLDKWLAQRD